MHQVFELTTALQLLTLRAALDSGVLPSAGRRTAVVSDTRPIPEVGAPFYEAPSARRLLDAFEVVRLSELIGPQHARTWSPEDSALPAWRERLGLGDDVRLYVSSLDAEPGRSLARCLPAAAPVLHAADLGVYGPSRGTSEATGALYPDLVPGARAHLFSGVDGAVTAVPLAALRETFTRALESTSRASSDEETALLVGQDFAEDGTLSAELDLSLHEALLDRAADRGFARAIFAPHPATSTSLLGPLSARARARGLTLVHAADGESVEFLAAGVSAVIGCSSTALTSSHRLLGVPTESLGAGTLMEEARPFENPRRVPAVISAYQFDAAFVTRPTAPELPDVLDAVTFAMQPRTHEALRAPATTALGAIDGTPLMRFFKRRRLTALGLPGALPSREPGLLRRGVARALRGLKGGRS